ncbi:2TM domain-containing protein [Aquimarina pacifica]|uniref:2TM domain-containing protein n=1 Tax=Aquimarina pacifica TaxID=1296415 RepID=UPI000470CEEB|nr:2TM domain-containing protein [Aquimarina pacifica]
MNLPNNENKAYEKARKRLKDEKGFYSHLTAYIIINIAILILRSNIVSFFKINTTQHNGFDDWLDWHVIFTPLLWGIGLALHGLWVFRKNSILEKFFKKSIFSKEWEERKIQEFIDDDDF